jgi:hypothetical protein
MNSVKQQCNTCVGLHYWDTNEKKSEFAPKFKLLSDVFGVGNIQFSAD